MYATFYFQSCHILVTAIFALLFQIKEISFMHTRDFFLLQFSKGPSTISAYQAYCINYKATIEYLGSIRQKEERFTEFERVLLNY